MSATTTDAHAGHATSTGIPNPKLAMWTFLGSECLLFGALLSVYLLYRGNVTSGPSPYDVYDIPFTSISSFVLLMSSLTMVLSHNAIVEGNVKRMRIWLLSTAFLGATFLSGQIYEFTIFVKEGFTVTSSPAGSAFFVLTSFHGAHVTLGVLMLLSIVGFSLKGNKRFDNPEVVEYVGLYWHFVDIVWIVLFTLVYLIPGPEAGY